MKTRKWSTAVLAVAMLMLTSLAMSGAVKAQDSTPADQDSFPVQIRFLNAMTSLDKVDVYINGDDDNQRVVEGLEYGVPSEAFTGTAPVTGVVIKQNVTGFDRYIYSTVVPTEAGKEYLVVISDLVLIPTEFDSSRVEAGMARVRLINAAPQAPAMDFFASEAGSDGALTDLIPVVTDIGYGGVTDGGELQAGSYDIAGVATGTTDVAVETKAVAFDAGQVYTVVVIGTPGSTEQPLTLVVVSAPAS
jgi:Domain of unknown function (DUF4397)